jgi:hypothetical protein
VSLAYSYRCGSYSEFSLEIKLWFWLRKTGARLNLKINLSYLINGPGFFVQSSCLSSNLNNKSKIEVESWLYLSDHWPFLNLDEVQSNLFNLYDWPLDQLG